jgi:hypothetical protein
MSELENVVTAVEGEVKSVAEAVVAEAAKVEEKVVEVVKAAVVQIATEEKLVLREAELEYLKSQMEIQRLSKIAEAKSTEYQNTVSGLFKKYVLDKAEYVFDGSINAFKKL